MGPGLGDAPGPFFSVAPAVKWTDRRQYAVCGHFHVEKETMGDRWSDTQASLFTVNIVAVPKATTINTVLLVAAQKSSGVEKGAGPQFSMRSMH